MFILSKAKLLKYLPIVIVWDPLPEVGLNERVSEMLVKSYNYF